MFTLNQTFYSGSDGFLSTDDYNDNEKTSINFLSSEKLDDEKWRVYFSIERIRTLRHTNGDKNGFSSSDTFSFIVEKGTELKFSQRFLKYVWEDVASEALFGKAKTSSKRFHGHVDHITLNNISLDSINVDFFLKEKVC